MSYVYGSYRRNRSHFVLNYYIGNFLDALSNTKCNLVHVPGDRS